MNTVNYFYPQTVKEAVDLLKEHQARIIAGGTDLVIELNNDHIEAEALIDITNIAQLDEITINENNIILGACVTHAAIACHPQLKILLTALTDGCRSVGSPQIRNIATVGGNIVNGQPAADATINLFALDASCEIVNAEGSRIEKLRDLFIGIGQTKIDPSCEILTKIIIPLPQTSYATAFQRIAPRNSLALPIVNCAVKIELSANKVTDAAIALAPVATTPFMASGAAQSLIGQELNAQTIAHAAQLAHDEANPRDSLLRGSGAYRKVLVKDLLEKALLEIATKLN